MEKLFDNVLHLLNDISKREHFVEPQITHQGQTGKGQGFLGDVYFVEITEKNDEKKLSLVVKQSTTSEYVRENFYLDVAYYNEKVFYETVWPAFLKLQKAHLKTLIFDNIAKCYATDVQKGKECLILKNLNALNYNNMPKSRFYDHDQAQFVLKKYGQLHGLSFAYKSRDADKFLALSKSLLPYWSILTKVELLEQLMEKGVADCLKYLNPTKDAQIIKKLEKYVNNTQTIFEQSFTYNGKHGAILQGDCWSNNILFKYNESGKIEDLKLIDFQISNLGTVVNDLSYSLYAGGTKDIFDNFDKYLKIYHDSLSDTCAKFGCTDFLSFEELKQEWRKHCKFGFLMSLPKIRQKLSKDKSQEEEKALVNEVDDNEEEIKKKLLEMVYHMYENDFL